MTHPRGICLAVIMTPFLLACRLLGFFRVILIVGAMTLHPSAVCLLRVVLGVGVLWRQIVLHFSPALVVPVVLHDILGLSTLDKSKITINYI